MAKKASPVQITIGGERLARNLIVGCLVVEALLLLLDAVVNYGRWTEIGAMRRLCNITREDGLATFFQVTQTFLAGMTLWLISVISRKVSGPGKATRAWRVLTGLFLFMAADDGAQIHERLGSTFKAAFKSDTPKQAASWGASLLDFFPSYPWHFVVLPVFAALGLFMFRFLWRQDAGRRARVLLVLAVSCFASAVLLDFIEGLEPDHRWNLFTWVKDTFELRRYTVSHFAKAIEECLEMAGITLLWGAFVRRLIEVSSQGLLVSFGAPRR